LDTRRSRLTVRLAILISVCHARRRAEWAWQGQGAGPRQQPLKGTKQEKEKRKERLGKIKESNVAKAEC